MKLALSRVRQPMKFDFILLTILILISLSSILAIYSAFPLMPSYLGPQGLLIKQAQFYILGFIAIGIIMYFGNENLRTFAIIGYKLMLIPLLYLFIDGQILQRIFGHPVLPLVSKINGATSWLTFPIIGSFQPSEYIKIFLIIVCAYVIVDHNEMKEDDSFESDLSLFFKLGKWLLIPMVTILLQPDTGIPFIILASIGVMVACSGIRKEWIFVTLIVVLIFLIIFFYLYYFNQSMFASIFGRGYKVARIYGWLDAEKYSTSYGLQLYSALLSLGSSGLTGHGLQASVITIPEAHTDFIFAVIGMNFGLIGTIFVVGICVALDLRIAIIAHRCQNNAEKLMLIGFLAMLIFQQVVNIGMVIGFLPITGITLPLISYGGSSVLSYMIAFGIIMNASMTAKKRSDFGY